MTEPIGGYRTLQQVGINVPAPAAMPPPSPEPWSPFEPPAREPYAPAAPTPLPITAPTDASGEPADEPARPRPETWTLPLLPGVNLSLPTPVRAAREGIEVLRDWHPRDPHLRTDGAHRSVAEARRLEREAATAIEQQPDASDDVSAADAPTANADQDSSIDKGKDKDERAGAAKVAMLIGIGGGFAQNGIDVVRLLKKYPEAMRAGQFDPSLGKLGRLPTAVGLTFLTRPDNRIVDPTAPAKATAASLGRSFTRFDSLSMKTSVLLGASLAAIQIGSSIPNLADALDNEGPWYQNLAQSTSGRAGVLQLTGGVIGASLFAKALRQTAGQGEGVIGRILAAGNAPIMAKPMWGRIGLATGALVMANEVGYLDMLNVDETRSTGQVLSDAVHKTPGLNDPTLRTGMLLAAGGIVGFKAHRAMLAGGGGIASIGKSHWIAGAAVAGLLGAQLLGGLSAMNKPPEADTPADGD